MLYYILLGSSYMFFSRGRALYHGLVLGVLLFIMGIGKNIYASPRPFMSNVNVKALDCTFGFGNPSGHNMFSTGALLAFFLDIFYPMAGEVVGQARDKKSALYMTLNSLFSAFTLTCIISIALARIYTGAHSIDQVIYGIQLGIWTAFYMHYCFRDMFIQHIDSMTPAYVESKKLELGLLSVFF